MWSLQKAGYTKDRSTEAERAFQGVGIPWVDGKGRAAASHSPVVLTLGQVLEAQEYLALPVARQPLVHEDLAAVGRQELLHGAPEVVDLPLASCHVCFFKREQTQSTQNSLET